jgi:transposase-like protein
MTYFEASEVICKLCGSSDVVKYGKIGDTQYFWCYNCKHKITALDTLPKMQTPIKEVASAVSMYYDGLSQNDIRRELKQIYNRDVSDFAVYNWIERFTKDAVNITNHYRPNVGYVWLADETVINVGGKQCWLLDIIDVKTRFLVASKLSPTRRVEDVQDVLKEAYTRTGRIPKVIMTDHLEAYIYGIKLTFGDKAKHLQVKKFTAKPNNNIIERMQGTIKERTKVMRDLKSLDTAQLVLDGFLVNYNYFRPHETLKTTPANKAQVRFPYDNWEGLIKHSEEAKMQAFQPHYPPIQPLPYIKPTAYERERFEQMLYKRRKLATKRTGIPHKPKSKGGRPKASLSVIQSVRMPRGYE